MNVLRKNATWPESAVGVAESHSACGSTFSLTAARLELPLKVMAMSKAIRASQAEYVARTSLFGEVVATMFMG